MPADSIPPQVPTLSLCLSASTLRQEAGRVPRHSLKQQGVFTDDKILSLQFFRRTQSVPEYLGPLCPNWQSVMLQFKCVPQSPQLGTLQCLCSWCFNFERSGLEEALGLGSSLHGSSGFMRRAKETCLSSLSCVRICRAEQPKREHGLIFSSQFKTQLILLGNSRQQALETIGHVIHLRSEKQSNKCMGAGGQHPVLLFCNLRSPAQATVPPTMAWASNFMQHSQDNPHRYAQRQFPGESRFLSR